MDINGPKIWKADIRTHFESSLRCVARRSANNNRRCWRVIQHETGIITSTHAFRTPHTVSQHRSTNTGNCERVKKKKKSIKNLFEKNISIWDINFEKKEKGRSTYQFSEKGLPPDSGAKFAKVRRADFSRIKFFVFAESDISIQKNLFRHLFANERRHLAHELWIDIIVYLLGNRENGCFIYVHI